MVNIGLLSIFWPLLFIIIALFYLFRLIASLVWARRFDAENEFGHGLMAIGMAFMLAPPDFQTPGGIRWSIILFVLAALWFCTRLLLRRPLLAILLRADLGRPAPQADAIHVFMYLSMAYMLLLMSNMAFSMALPTTALNCACFVAFIFLLFSYMRAIWRNLQMARLDRLKLGADLAHALMNLAMAWMFIDMLTMTISMRVH